MIEACLDVAATRAAGVGVFNWPYPNRPWDYNAKFLNVLRTVYQADAVFRLPITQWSDDDTEFARWAFTDAPDSAETWAAAQRNALDAVAHRSRDHDAHALKLAQFMDSIA